MIEKLKEYICIYIYIYLLTNTPFETKLIIKKTNIRKEKRDTYSFNHSIHMIIQL